MTMRSKQWYTKTSRLLNSFANNSTGRLRDLALSNKIIGEATGGVNKARIRKGRKGFQRERNRRLRSLWATAQNWRGSPNYLRNADAQTTPAKADRGPASAESRSSRN